MWVKDKEIRFSPIESTVTPQVLIKKIEELSGLNVSVYLENIASESKEEYVSLEISHELFKSKSKLSYYKLKKYVWKPQTSLNNYLRQIMLRAFPQWTKYKWGDPLLPEYVKHLEELQIGKDVIFREAIEEFVETEISEEEGTKEIDNRLQKYEEEFYAKYSV